MARRPFIECLRSLAEKFIAQFGEPSPNDEGAEAYRMGIPFEACPYPLKDERRDEWMLGWLEAEEADPDNKVSA